MRWRVLGAVGMLALAGAAGSRIADRGSRLEDRGSQSRALWLFYDTTAFDAAQISSAITQAGGEVRYASRWLHAVSADISLSAAHRIAGVTLVQAVGRVYSTANRDPRSAIRDPHNAILDPRSASTIQLDSAAYGPNYTALRELGVPQAHTLGFTARQIRIAIIDTGFEPDHEAFSGARIIARRDFINRDNNVANEPADRPSARDQEIHGTWVWSILGGNRPGKIIGPAYEANFLLAKVDVEDFGENLAADEDRWVAAVEWADSNGAKVINSSLGYRFFADRDDYPPSALDGDNARSTRMADEAARRGIVVVVASGNEGPGFRTLVAPADGDSVISVGAVDSAGVVTRSSSRGPSADGRIKPELVARGVNVYAADSRRLDGYDFVSEGTSLATPFIAGGAAMFVQAWPNLSVMAVRNALLLSASQAARPDSIRGFGLPNIASAIVFPEGIHPAGVATVDATNALTTLAPTFNWRTPLVLPQVRPRYRLELANDSAFTSIFYTDTTSTAFSLIVNRPITPRPAIWWRVVAETFPGIRRASSSSGPLSMPDWVRLTVFNDAAGHVVPTTRPAFRWEPVAAPAPVGPLRYDLQILRPTGEVVQALRDLNTASVTLDEALAPNLAYRWRVIAKSISGVADTVDSRGSFVVASAAQPPATLLYPPFPNPFPRPQQLERETRFWFDLHERMEVDLAIYDLRGRLIKRLIPAASSCGRVTLEPGQYGRGALAADAACINPSWDGTDLNNQRVARGVYVARLRAGGQVSSQRILFTPER